MADNASITILRNTQANINAEPIKDGNILFTTDQANNKIYADVGTERIKIGGSVDTDTELSTTSTNPVQNKIVTNSINDVRGQICTNLLNSIAPTETINGVTFTNNRDGTYTVNGTASDIIYYRLANLLINLFLSRKYKIVGCPQGGSISTYSLYDDSNSIISVDVGNGAVYTPKNKPMIYIRIMKGTTCNNLLFKPMLTTDLSATYDDFVPYTGDSGRLNEDVAKLFDVIRPVGSLFQTTDANFNPNTAKGWHGTWERITDCVIYAAGASDTIGAIVGSNTHGLTIAELPRHTHSIPALSGSTSANGLTMLTGLSTTNFGYGFGVNSLSGYFPFTADSDTTRHSHTVSTEASTTGASGSGTSIDIRPRRLNSIVWRRIS